ncbi:3-hydroxy-D-aspartate aldolase [Ochrobactrum sp. 19YEA23]|uniref:DSD1 family PLP-dependent enzyme n=1 Tax=Ochrobactrum sp. 19YEA23 TaxID=3039854 RepID=UPI00247964C1|nr:3-hydroxy-D-aspartate aldolase [Ochrobactrum sp. 19YEA23]
MLQVPPAQPGMREADIDTPALIIDLDKMEDNLDRMATYCASSGIRLRAHAKTHKSPVIAHWQMARSAVGQCVQKTGEAEVLAWGGVSDILVSNEVVSERKLARLLALSGMSDVAVCADNGSVVNLVEKVAADSGKRFRVLVEINVGGMRCGIAPGEPAAELAAAIANSKHLIFGGLQSYHGAAQHLRSEEERFEAIRQAVEKTEATITAIRKRGLSCDIVGGGGTGTFRYEAASQVYTELQAGSYLFMDADYSRNDPMPPFSQSLFVLSTVMSAPRPDLAVLDCGHKGIAVDSGLPLVYGHRNVTYAGASDEHGALIVHADGERLQIGEKLRLVPGHCDPTVDRYDWYVGVRKGRVECVFPVAARGMMQ